MNILLIGHSIIDHYKIENIELIKPGGIYYSAAGMLYIKNNEDNLFLLTGINKNSYNLFEKVYSKLNLTLSTELDNMPEVSLKIYEHQERDEFYKNISSPLSLDKINDWNLFNGILINMITGFDISLEQLKYIRKNFNGLVYLDIHTLSRGVDENLKRNFRLIPQAEEWLSNIDIVQCNENELKTLFNYEDDYMIIKKVMTLKPELLVLTKGMNGAEVYFKDNHQIGKYSIQAEKVVVKNKVGCGDIFGSVFFYLYLRTHDIMNSLKIANKIAALSVSSVNIEDWLKLC